MPLYACLADGCTQVFRVWQQARLHMRSCSENYCELGKPKLSDSLAKGKLIAPDDFDVVDANDPFKGKLIVPEPPSEAAIVSVLEQYCNRCSDSMTFRKHASAHLREHFGHFPFAAFGFGTLKEFLSNHGFHTPDFDAMAARDLWMDDVAEDLAPCQRCRRALSREAFSKTQLQKWDAKGRRARPHCRACLEDRERRRGRPSRDEADNDTWKSNAEAAANDEDSKVSQSVALDTSHGGWARCQSAKPDEQETWAQEWKQPCEEPKHASRPWKTQWEDRQWQQPAADSQIFWSEKGTWEQEWKQPCEEPKHTSRPWKTQWEDRQWQQPAADSQIFWSEKGTWEQEWRQPCEEPEHASRPWKTQWEDQTWQQPAADSQTLWSEKGTWEQEWKQPCEEPNHTSRPWKTQWEDRQWQQPAADSQIFLSEKGTWEQEWRQPCEEPEQASRPWKTQWEDQTWQQPAADSQTLWPEKETWEQERKQTRDGSEDAGELWKTQRDHEPWQQLPFDYENHNNRSCCQ
eukprot:Skav228161  [mRNA]  locus=scaffold439:126607:128687:+ [translate_table: standard]